VPDFRVAAYREAQKCLRYVSKQNPEQPSFWANLLGAIANATLATVPDSVMGAVMADDWDRERQHQRVREHINKKLVEK
jgi:hypothetical protein